MTFERRRWTTAELFEEHGDAVYRIVRFLGVAPAEIDDVVQDVFLVAHRRLESFEGRSTPRTWLHGICIRVVAQWRRQNVKHSGDPSDIEELTREGDVGPDERVDLERARRTFVRVLAELPEEQREAFVLHEIEGLSVRDIAELFGTSSSTVHYRIVAAREAVRRAVARMRGRTPREET